MQNMVSNRWLFKKYYAIGFLSVVLLISGQTAFAAETPVQWFNRIVNNVLTMVVWPVFLGLVIIMFIWAGILFLTAEGEPSKVSQAKKAVMYGIIGIVVALAAFSAVSLMRTILGLPAA